MTTMFHFTPTITTAEMRKNAEVIKQMHDINVIRKNRKDIIGNGHNDFKPGDDTPVEFDYILLCNKICGNSHYNMQMTVIIDSEEDYKKWMATKKPFYTKAAPAETKKGEVAENK
jgi:cytochrome c oxidase subunit II